MLLYKYVLENELQELNMSEHCIDVNQTNESIKFMCKDTSTTLTIFSIPNTMRYIPFTIDTLMGTVISMFGYQSDLHRAMAVFVLYVVQSHIKE